MAAVVAQKDAEREAAVAAAVADAVAKMDAEREAAVTAAVMETTARMEGERKDDLRAAIQLLNQRGMYVLAYKLSFMMSKSVSELVALISQVERSHGRARQHRHRVRRPEEPAEAF